MLVADAVAVEPVSTPKFPANREINREFHQIGPLCKILKADTRADSKASSEIPYATEQGIILAEQGIEEQRISLAKTESSPDEVFSRRTHCRPVALPSKGWLRIQ
jgi:hypothetical protein